MKLKVKVFISREDDGTYSMYVDDKSNLPYGLVGEGNTVEEAMAEWNEAYEDMRKIYEEDGVEFPEADFEFVYDLPSFLLYYAGKLTYSGLSRLTGVAAAQLSHYAHGVRNPSPKTTKKIQSALNAFGKELSSIHLV